MNFDNILVTSNQINKLRHMIGFDWHSVRKGEYIAYRNGYAACDYMVDMEQLCRLGICQKTEIAGKYIYYCLTANGAKLLGRLLGIEIVLADEKE